MKNTVEIEEIEITRGEKFLAFILAIFIAIGLIWGYSKLDEDSLDSWSFVSRLIYVLVFLAVAFVVLDRTRRRQSRFLPAAASFVAASTLLAIVMAGDYLTDYIDVESLGPLVLSVVGIALSLTAFVALQRFLARHTPIRRVRKHECPFCGYPVRENVNCEGCGRVVVGTCSTCQAPRRVGTAFCGSCGAAGASPD